MPQGGRGLLLDLQSAMRSPRSTNNAGWRELEKHGIIASNQPNFYKDGMKKKELRNRRFKLHWGGGWITEEARSVTQYHEPSIQLLSFDSGAKSLRFCYYHDGMFQGGPLILNESHLASLRREIRKNKTIYSLMRKLV
jgi:hypothetical protein